MVDKPKADAATNTGDENLAALKEQLANATARAEAAEKRANEAPDAAATAEALAAANKRAEEAEKALHDKVSEPPAVDEGIKAQLADLAARLEKAEGRTAQTDADDKADRDAAFAPRVIPGETDEFGKPWNPPKPFKEPRAYRATEKVYVDGVLYEPGDTVVTNQRPSRTLVPITLAEKVAMEASAEQHGDVNLADMSSTELRAWLASKGVDHGGLKDRDSLLSAALAWNDPTR